MLHAAVLYRAVCYVYKPLSHQAPEVKTLLMNMNGLSSSLPTRHTSIPATLSPPHPKAHHSVLSHSVTHDNQEGDYSDQINYALIQNAMALTTLNPALPKHWRRLITLILLVYAAELPTPTFAASVPGERKWIVLQYFIDIAFHFWWPGQYFTRHATQRCCFSIYGFL